METRPHSCIMCKDHSVALNGEFTNQDFLKYSQAHFIIDLLLYLILPMKRYNCWSVDRSWFGLRINIKSDR